MESIFLQVTKQDYSKLLNIQPSDSNYYKIAFIDDGSGIITRGKLYVNSPYWIKVVDNIPVEQEKDTIYLIKE